VFVMDEEETQIAPCDRQFASKSTGKRAMQLFAGPMMNFVLAIVIFFILGLIQGVPMKEAIIDMVEPGTPDAEAGFKHGDEVISVDGTPIPTSDAFTDIVQESPEKEVTVTLLRQSDTTEEVTVVPARKETQWITFGQIGVTHMYEKSVFRTLEWGITQTYDTTKLILTNLMMLITGQYSIDMLSG